MKVKVVAGKRGKYLLRWVDANSKTRERTTQLSADKRNLKDALGLASRLESELAGDSPPDIILTKKQKESFKVLDDPQLPSSVDGNWLGFKKYVFEAHLSGLSKSYSDTMGPILSQFEKFADPVYVSDVTPSIVRRWFSSMREHGKSVHTIRTYWRHLRAFLSIAKDDGLLNSIPKVRLPKIDDQSLSKGRPINLEEFERMRDARLKLKTTVDRDELRYFLEGLWYGGLRISEAYRLAWDESTALSVDDDGPKLFADLERSRPMFVILQQKNRTSQLLPMTPDFADHLKQTKSIRRFGFVYRLPMKSGKRVTFEHTKNLVRECGKFANIKSGNGKTATAHDLRRSFAERWAAKVLPQVLQQLMRHKEISTTMKYYAQMDAERLADALYERGGQKGGHNMKPEKQN